MNPRVVSEDLVLPLYNVTSLLFSVTDFGVSPGAFACDGDESGAVIPHAALLSHAESCGLTALQSAVHTLGHVVSIQESVKKRGELLFVQQTDRPVSLSSFQV